MKQGKGLKPRDRPYSDGRPKGDGGPGVELKKKSGRLATA